MFNKLSKIFVVIMLGVVFIVPNFANAGRTEGAEFNFDVNPKTLTASREQSVQLNFTAGITIYGQEFRNYCGVNVSKATWSVRQITSGTTPGYLNSLQLSTQTIDLDTYQLPVLKQYASSATVKGSSTNEKRYFYALLHCGLGGIDLGPGGSKQISQSSVVEIAIIGITGSGTGGTTKPGQTQTYPFEITNPLKGGANDFTSLVKILAQWIFNLAIPIAVAMIVYSGILFLTAAGEMAKVTKAREVLKYAVIGLAIILIGSGFVTLIQSVLELGSPSLNSGQSTLPTTNNTTGGTTTTLGVIGNKCSADRDCITGLKCQDSICKRPTGNWATEPCNSARNCDLGLTCDKSDSGLQPIDGQDLGTCVSN